MTASASLVIVQLHQADDTVREFRTAPNELFEVNVVDISSSDLPDPVEYMLAPMA